MNQQYSPDQLQMMRQILEQHGNQEQNQQFGLREFDLNNPPKVPYVFQEFPRVVYHHAKRKTQIAHHAADLAAALEAGWTKEPFPGEQHAEDELDLSDLAEVAKADAMLAKKRK